MKSWQNFEEEVKTLSSYIYNCDAQKENINGIDFDCVLKPENDYWVIVEVTEDETLTKVRTDISKFAACRLHLFTKQIYSKFFLVLKKEPTNTMKTTGEGNHVEVLSFESYAKNFFDIASYRYTRNKKTFGSSVNPISGEPDSYNYTPVHYEYVDNGKELTLKDISKRLINGRRIILIGNYGTGKSRCIRELFQLMDPEKTNKILYPIAINLKEHWGIQRAEEIIRRHLGMMGLSNMVDSLLKILDTDRFVFLLDGFDEVGAQIWSDDPVKIKQIRASSLRAVKDLITATKSPVLITGREHYFNSEKEMLSVLGIEKNETEIIKCKDEFTPEEMKNYLKNLDLTINLPTWLPRRPLICQIINTIEKTDLENIFIDTDSAIDFWNTLIQNICKREARISTALEWKNIYKILLELADLTRSKKDNTGPITLREINKAFEKVVGIAPVDDSAVMLQRLPALSRVSSESTDRQFIDYYILDGLRADLLIDIVYSNRRNYLNRNWQHSLRKTGVEIVAKKISDDKSANVFIEFLKEAININENKILIGDIFSSLVKHDSKHNIDLNGLVLNQTTIGSLDFSNCLIDNVIIKDSFIDELDITNYSFSKITFRDCCLRKVYGISSERERPDFFMKSEIELYEQSPMLQSNRLTGLKPSHMIFVSIIKKLFLLNTKQSEKELCRNYGTRTDRKRVSEILKLLVKEKIISKPDSAENYSPKTFNRKRVLKILDLLNKSKDPIWSSLGEIE